MSWLIFQISLPKVKTINTKFGKITEEEEEEEGEEEEEEEEEKPLLEARARLRRRALKNSSTQVLFMVN